MIGLATLCTGIFLLGCATSPIVKRFQEDPRFQDAARQLATAYLESQKRGEPGTQYGSGAGQFYNLAEYKIVSYGCSWGEPAIFTRVKAGNHGGGNPVWEDYAIEFTHNPQLESSGDPYLGLRIRTVGPSIVKF